MLSPVGTTEPVPQKNTILQPSLTGLPGLLYRCAPAMNRRPAIKSSILDASGLHADSDHPGARGPEPDSSLSQRNHPSPKSLVIAWAEFLAGQCQLILCVVAAMAFSIIPVYNVIASDTGSYSLRLLCLSTPYSKTGVHIRGSTHSSGSAGSPYSDIGPVELPAHGPPGVGYGMV